MSGSGSQTEALAKRIHERDHKSEEYLLDRPSWARAWSRLHLKLADAVDGFFTVSGNRWVSGLIGAAMGLAKGALIGFLIGTVLTVSGFAPLVTVPFAFIFGAELSGIAASVIVGASALTLYESRRFFFDAANQSSAKKGAKIADKIAQHGHALAEDAPKTKAKAIEQVYDKTHEHMTASEWQNLEDIISSERSLPSPETFKSDKRGTTTADRQLPPAHRT